jgi:succinate dehydrogenase / fumarate reductase membrane anchor subunit
MTQEPQPTRSIASRVLFLGSAKSGTEESWHMRVTSIALVPLSIAFVFIVVSLIGKDYEAARAILAKPLPALVFLLFILAGIYHMKLGAQSIIDDYVHAPQLKDIALIGNLFFAVAVGLACIYATLKLSFT